MAGEFDRRQGHEVPRVEWLPEAAKDVERLHAFLELKNKRAASNAVKCILDGINILKNSPNIGRPMDDETGRRELFLPYGAGAYVLRYKTTNEVVVIIRAWHSKENLSIK